MIRGVRGKKGMYMCQLVDCKDNKVVAMNGNVIDNEGVVFEKHLSGEEVDRAKRARKIHESMHVNEHSLGKGLDNGCYANGGDLTYRDVQNSIILFGKCRACMEGSMKAPSKRKSTSRPASKIGWRLAMDLLPLSETSLGGNNWVLIAVDDKSGYIFMVGLKRKTTEDVEEGINKILLEVISCGHAVKEILFDNEQVFNAVGNFVRNKGVIPLYTPSGLHNNLSERYTQTVKTKKRIIQSSLPYQIPGYLKLEALIAAARSCNASPGYKSGSGHTPYGLMMGKKPFLDDFPFGSTGLAYSPRKDTSEERSEWAVMLEQKHNGSYRVYIPSRHLIYSVRKFERLNSYPLSWGWKRRDQFRLEGKIDKYEESNKFRVSKHIEEKEEVRELARDNIVVSGNDELLNDEVGNVEEGSLLVNNEGIVENKQSDVGELEEIATEKSCGEFGNSDSIELVLNNDKAIEVVEEFVPRRSMRIKGKDEVGKYREMNIAGSFNGARDVKVNSSSSQR